MPAEKQTENSIGIIVLAAGSSSRLGKPKQLLVHNGQTLLQQSLDVALATAPGAVIVVLGAKAAEIKETLIEDAANVIVNTDWPDGMASSIRCGVTALLENNPAVQVTILMVCDQPFVTSALLTELITAHQATGKPIVTCRYADTFGPPVLFHRSLFAELLQLQGDVGARSVIRQHANEVAVVAFAKGSIDVDTESDYHRLIRET